MNLTPDTTVPPSSADQCVLAIETSSRNGSLALAAMHPAGEQLLAYRPFDQTRPTRDHAVDMLPMLDRTLAELGRQPTDIAEVYVSAGPGSFTGLRIAFTFARSLAFSIGCRLVLVPTVEVLAENAPADAINVAVVLDAKRSQVYTAVFSRPAAGGPLTQIYPTGVVAPAEMLAASPRPLHVLGEGIDYHREALSFGPDVIELPRELWPPRADAVYRLGRRLAQAGRFTPPDAAIPTYIRRPEAEEVWERRHGKSC